MKNLLVALFAVTLLFCGAVRANAGFVINNNLLGVSSSARAGINTENTKTDEKAASLKERILRKFIPAYNPYGHGDANRDARLAVTFALWGLLFAPLGILAIVFGTKALRHHARNQDVAIISIVLGSLEVLFMIFFIIYLLLWAPLFFVY